MTASAAFGRYRIGEDQSAGWMTKMDSLGVGLGAARDELPRFNISRWVYVDPSATGEPVALHIQGLLRVLVV